MNNNKLSDARKHKKDEFYTLYKDIENEMNAYYYYNNNIFKNKIVLCPCDNPEWSNFAKFFTTNFNLLGLKKLICTSFNKDGKGKLLILNNLEEKNINITYLKGNGDFRSEEITKFRDEADIIITNPPFSLFREFITWVNEANKKFSIIGNINAISYNEVFPLIKNNKVWLGNGFKSMVGYFSSPYEDIATSSGHREGYIRVSGVTWFTNIDHGLRHKPMNLSTMNDNLKYNKKLINKLNSLYNKTQYPYYDNFNAIEVPYSDSIPSDYNGVMGVPITFLNKYCSEQFEIIGKIDTGKIDEYNLATPTINNKTIFKRLAIRKK